MDDTDTSGFDRLSSIVVIVIFFAIFGTCMCVICIGHEWCKHRQTCRQTRTQVYPDETKAAEATNIETATNARESYIIEMPNKEDIYVGTVVAK